MAEVEAAAREKEVRRVGWDFYGEGNLASEDAVNSLRILPSRSGSVFESAGGGQTMFW